MHSSPPIYFVVFTAVTAAAVLLQALVLLAIFLAVRKSMAKLLAVTGEVKEQALPVIVSARSVMEDVAPKLKTAVNNFTEVSFTLRQQADHANKTVEGLLSRTEVQVRRVDEMISAALDTVDQAAAAVENAVAAPARRVSGIIQGVKTGVEVFLARRKGSSDRGARSDFSGQKPA